jgi:hypothetical protein
MLIFLVFCSGCRGVSDPGDGVDAADAVPTWRDDVAPILAANCAECHVAGGSAPFPLTSHAEAAAYANAIAAATAARTMPPFNLDNSGECRTWADARWLTDAEIATIGAWARGGAPAGDEEGDARAVAPAQELDRVDLSLTMAEPYTPDEAAEDDYRCFVLDPDLAEDRFVTGFQVRLGVPAMVHHVTLFALDSPEAEEEAAALDAAEPGPGYTCLGDTIVASRWLVGTGPGVAGNALPEGTGTRMSAGRKTLLQMHYNRVNGTWPDQTAVDLRLESEVADETVIQRIAATDLVLPPGEAEVVVTESVEIYDDYTIWGVWPHMHDLGTRLEVTHHAAEGDACVARVDRWQFHWQGFAFYAEPVQVRAGDTLELTCAYDTTSRTTTTTWGEATSDEMCLGFFYVTER